MLIKIVVLSIENRLANNLRDLRELYCHTILAPVERSETGAVHIRQKGCLAERNLRRQLEGIPRVGEQRAG